MTAIFQRTARHDAKTRKPAQRGNADHAMRNPTLDAGIAGDRQAAIFGKEEIAREWTGFYARAAALLVIGIWFLFLMPPVEALYYHGLLAVFVAIGYGHYRLTAYRPRAHWARLVLIASDFGLLAFATLADNPVAEWYMPPPLRLESGNFGYFLIVLIGVGLSYSTWRMIASGIIAGIAWAGGYFWVMTYPDAFTADGRGPVQRRWFGCGRASNLIDAPTGQPRPATGGSTSVPQSTTAR